MDTTISILFLLKKILGILLVPPLLFLCMLLAGLLLLRWRPRTGKALLWTGFVLALFFSTPASVVMLAKPLEIHPVLDPQRLKEAQAIVILGGGQLRFAPEYRNQSPNRITIERLRYGARLARQSSLPVLVTGGAPTGWSAEALAMVDTLTVDFNVVPAWIETRALDTHDNAVYSAALLAKNNIQRIVLVTHASHMRRAVTEFEAAGLQVIPAPTMFFSLGPNGEEFFDYVPSATMAYYGFYVMHEWLGIAAQKVRQAI